MDRGTRTQIVLLSHSMLFQVLHFQEIHPILLRANLTINFLSQETELPKLAHQPTPTPDLTLHRHSSYPTPLFEIAAPVIVCDMRSEAIALTADIVTNLEQNSKKGSAVR
jgi:hypothetical protein